MRNAVIDPTMYATAPPPNKNYMTQNINSAEAENSSMLCVLKSKNFNVYLLPGIIKTWVYKEGSHTVSALQWLTV